MQQPLTLWNARLIDGAGNPVRDHAAVTLVDGRIAEGGQARGRPGHGARAAAGAA